jgi:hypothetical protein
VMWWPPTQQFHSECQPASNLPSKISTRSIVAPMCNGSRLSKAAEW